jgi:hypothetical protein
MAKCNSNASQQCDATPSTIQGPCHTYDNWLVPDAKHSSDAQFAADVLDVARGAQVIASIVAAHVVDLNAIAGGAGDSVRTLLSESDTEALARLAVFSLGQLYRMAENRVDFLNSKAAPGVRA